MKTLLIIFLFLNLVSSSIAAEIKLQLSFYPSILESASITLEKEGDRYFIQLTVNDSIGDSSAVSVKAIEDLMAYFDSYRVLPDTSRQPMVPHINGLFSQDELVKSIAFNRPKRGSKNHELVEILLAIMYARFDDVPTINYLENLEQQFDFGLGLKLLSKEPIIYKLYGRVSYFESDAFYAFLLSLPVDKEIKIDMSNFKSMAKLFYPTLREVALKNPQLTFTNCTFNAFRHLRKASVPREQIIYK